MKNVKILGTSHIAKESVRTIKALIEKDKPDIVAVELDAQRLPMLFGKQRKIRFSDIKQVGITGFIFSIFGGFLQRKLGEKVGSTPGCDIKQAILSANKVNSKIYLIDRPIHITMRRLSQSLTLWEKIKFIFYILFGFLIPAPKEVKSLDLTKVPREKLISMLKGELKKKFPILYRVLVKERDDYMTTQIKRIHAHFPQSSILVIVGAGHIKGLKENLK